MVKRTTLLMDEHLLKEVKKVSVEQNCTLKDITEEALWYYLHHGPFHHGISIPREKRFSSLKGSLKGIKVTPRDFDEIEREILE